MLRNQLVAGIDEYKAIIDNKMFSVFLFQHTIFTHFDTFKRLVYIHYYFCLIIFMKLQFLVRFIMILSRSHLGRCSTWKGGEIGADGPNYAVSLKPSNYGSTLIYNNEPTIR